ncbi:Aminopeptidase N, partial [Armadillidium vulgare]
ENKWFIINVQKTGFYRVNYDDSNWLRLKEQLLKNFSLIHRLNREQIIDDAFNLARIGYVEYDLPLGISDYMKMEKDLTVWTTFLINFQYILDMAGNPKNDTIEFFDKFLQELIVPLYKRTGFIDSPLDSYDIQELRILSTEWACRVGYKPCLETANKLFYQWLNLPFNMRSRERTDTKKKKCYRIVVLEIGSRNWWSVRLGDYQDRIPYEIPYS